MRKPDLKFLRITRWTILVPLVIYISLLYIKYSNKNVKLKSSNDIQDDNGIKNLFSELEAATEGKLSDRPVEIPVLKNPGIDRRINTEIDEIEKTENRENPRQVLEEVFRRADTNENQELDIQELAKWIHAKITEHINRAMRDNVGLFTTIDNNPRNGK